MEDCMNNIHFITCDEKYIDGYLINCYILFAEATAPGSETYINSKCTTFIKLMAAGPNS